MSTATAEVDFKVANPHALAIILDASETRSIIAASDIFDINGIKLWARDQPVSQDLQRKLMDRALRQPLETCLVVEGGVTPTTLQDEIRKLIELKGPLTPLLQPHLDALLKGAAAVRLHPVVQLLLSAVQTSRPATFAHATEAMALAGAIIQARSHNHALVVSAMTAGLIHDVGEMYISPAYGEADAQSTLDVESYRQLVVHPHIGHLLLTQLTDYPRDISRAVAEHHERLDGSGYPHRLTAERISPLGRLLAAVEVALAALRLPGATLHHASVALRVVPGEFDVLLAGPLSAAARTAPPMTPRQSLPDIQNALARLDIDLQETMTHVEGVLPGEPSAGLQRAADLSLYLLHKLRLGWNESGLWNPEAIGTVEAAEVEAVQVALRARLKEIERAARLAAGPLDDDDEDRLNQLCAGLTAEMSPS
jgi:hypothetical protein